MIIIPGNDRLIRFLAISGLVLAIFPARSWAENSKKIKVKLAWENIEFAGKMQTYELKPGIPPPLWETRSVKSIDQAPVAGEIEGNIIEARRGAVEKFVLVIKNETDKPLYFFAAPHAVTPVQYSLGLKFKCLCINHAFSVPAGEVWYRVVELRLDPDIEGDTLEIMHNLIGITKERMEKFNLPPQGGQAGHDQH